MLSFLKLGHSRPLFLYFHLFNTVVSNLKLSMIGLEPRIFGFGSNRSTNYVTTATQRIKFLWTERLQFIIILSVPLWPFVHNIFLVNCLIIFMMAYTSFVKTWNSFGKRSHKKLACSVEQYFYVYFIQRPSFLLKGEVIWQSGKSFY